MNMLGQLWQDEAGSVQTAELVILCTILCIGIIPGLAAVRDALNTELADTAAAISALDQGVQSNLLTIDDVDEVENGENIQTAADAFGDD